ncbi:selenoprotein hypothetical protein [Limosa lapponica baueri]|uniref:Uncharacterized protein n=1 Tax=Limosa lapponica baueri TaxID=1758121 RepID=A0A2I0T3B4_LIMLA|nr:selenoprotein hypothetical protein [Limosa lapponica baueri]
MKRSEPDVVVRRQEALAAARLRMQEELNAQAERYKEKQRQAITPCLGKEAELVPGDPAGEARQQVDEAKPP